MGHQGNGVTTVGGGAVFVVPIDEAACQVAVGEIDGAGEKPVLRPEKRAAIENAEPDTENSQVRRVRCTEADACDLIQRFDRGRDLTTRGRLRPLDRVRAVRRAAPPAPRRSRADVRRRQWR